MGFRVDITEPALRDAEEYVDFIRAVRKEPEAAERWFRGLVQAIYSLEDLPERCPLIPEQDDFPFEIRHLLYFSHRIIFAVERQIEPTVVYRIYHGARYAIPCGPVIEGVGWRSESGEMTTDGNEQLNKPGTAAGLNLGEDALLQTGENIRSVRTNFALVDEWKGVRAA